MKHNELFNKMLGAEGRAADLGVIAGNAVARLDVDPSKEAKTRAIAELCRLRDAKMMTAFCVQELITAVENIDE